MSLPEELRQQIESEFSLLKGWSELSQVLELVNVIWEEKPKRCLEVGVFSGRGLIPIGLALKKISADSYIVGLDPWNSIACCEYENEANREWWSKVDLNEIYRELMETIFRLGLENVALTLRARSQDAYWMFNDLDLLIIDGNHSEEISCQDVTLYLPRVKSGGLVSFDDTTWESTQKALQMVATQCIVVKSFENHTIYRKI